MGRILKGFRDFLLEGDLITVAVGLIMGLASYAVATALVEGLITPLIAAIFGEPDFASLSFTINDSEFRYGLFLNALLTFVATAIAVYFFVVVPYNAYKERKGASPATRTCPECATAISVDAKRCPNCTSPVPAPDPT